RDLDADGHAQREQFLRHATAAHSDPTYPHCELKERVHSVRKLKKIVRIPYFFTETRYTTPAPSSLTRSEPSFATATPTGRPFTLWPPASGTNPSKNVSGSPVALPSLNGTNAIW